MASARLVASPSATFTLPQHRTRPCADAAVQERSSGGAVRRTRYGLEPLAGLRFMHRRRGSPDNADAPPTVPAVGQGVGGVGSDLTAGCSHACRAPSPAIPAAGMSPDDLAELLSHLYVCRGLSTYRIGGIVGMDRQRVGRLLAKLGVAVKPRGAGRRRHCDDELAALTDLIEHLYVGSGLTCAQISAVTGVPQGTVRDRLHAQGVRMRTRGRLNRQDRVTLPADAIARWYVSGGLSAADTGRLLGVSGQLVLRTAHDEGLPVRVGGPAPCRGPTEIQLVDALYADAQVRQTLSRHGVAPRPAGGPIWRRFPTPVTVGPELVEELYISCGLGVRHIELLTGQPSRTILRLLDARGIARRAAGGRSPFLRRWRATGTVTAHGACSSARGC